MLYVSQPTRTAQIKKLEDALRLRLLGGRRRMVRNLLPMPERVLQDLNTVQLDVQTGSLECRRKQSHPTRARCPTFVTAKGASGSSEAPLR